MNKLRIFLILTCLSMMAVTLHAVALKTKLSEMALSKPKNSTKTVVPSKNSTSPEVSSDPEYSAVCTSDDRGKKGCGGTLTTGCLCYNNGTCLNTTVNRCANCSDDSVFSVLVGEVCPTSQPYLCTPPIAGVKYTCTQESSESCVCTLNGTCFERNASHCIDCESPNNLAVFEGKSCPAKYLQTVPSKYFIPKACEHTDSMSVNCLKTQTPGCVCYYNGSCEYRADSNECLLCFNKNVASFNQGENCPHYTGKLYSCNSTSTYSDCSGTESSCVCLKNGTCSTQDTNHCKGCLLKNAAEVVEGGKCPLASYIIV